MKYSNNSNNLNKSFWSGAPCEFVSGPGPMVVNHCFNSPVNQHSNSNIHIDSVTQSTAPEI